MEKQLKTVLLFVIVLMMASCRAGDCGCPMSMEEQPEESFGSTQYTSETLAVQASSPKRDDQFKRISSSLLSKN